jgi:hypothetical protein
MVPFQTKTIDLGDSRKLLVEELPPEIQALVNVHDEWKTKLRDTQLNTSMIQYALERVSVEISGKVQEFLEPPAEETDSDTPPVNEGDSSVE